MIALKDFRHKLSGELINVEVSPETLRELVRCEVERALEAMPAV